MWAKLDRIREHLADFGPDLAELWPVLPPNMGSDTDRGVQILTPKVAPCHVDPLE